MSQDNGVKPDPLSYNNLRLSGLQTTVGNTDGKVPESRASQKTCQETRLQV